MKANFVMEPEAPCDTSLVELSWLATARPLVRLFARYQLPICAFAYSACGNVARSEIWHRRFSSPPAQARQFAGTGPVQGLALWHCRNLINNAFCQRRHNPVASAESLEDATATASPA